MNLTIEAGIGNEILLDENWKLQLKWMINCTQRKELTPKQAPTFDISRRYSGHMPGDYTGLTKLRLLTRVGTQITRGGLI